MESAKRKRRGGDDDDRRLPSSNLRPAEEHPQANDNDVEEFFSILCRMRDATRSIAAARKAMAPAPPRWTPAFALEDFVRPDAAMVEADRGASAEREVEEDHDLPPPCLDLNADPEPEVLAPENPCGEATSRCSRAPA
ncbi:protein NEGATIVE REGULATOR OF RESISTANCE-like [Zingiber officinale]|uniref:Uncharacterized protein n=1 Tax=Zingiber officinale TaxID=94328 RepID=A0A8J5KEJ9_ZINOF|nr:protein NEGATIVE REGULATOR OF RESISTANCE-like [Zingiber officinale]KAG6477989.1 hypothetical protein ZIOFF_061421 [Zingiber officinale]